MSQEHIFQTRVRWAGTQQAAPSAYTRDMVVEPEGKAPILGSSSRRFRGDDARYNPEDLMLASLAECHILTYLSLAGAEGIRVQSLAVEVSGVLANVEGKMRFREATLRARTQVESASDIERATQLHDGAHTGCFMSNSVNFPIAVEANVSAG
jgi:organic hydroperoxide reductase OsmC/OhrA